GSTTSGADGAFYFVDVPVGRVGVQAADWGVSRTPALTELILRAGKEAEVELILAESGTRVVTGQVWFRDPFLGLVPVVGATAFVTGPGVFAASDADGRYRIEGVPVQGLGEGAYRVTVIDFARSLQGQSPLPPIADTSP